jgi:hypothetical protein
MTTKTVSQLNTAGYFVCPAIADESPLEPGVFLLPAGCVDLEPPTEIPANNRVLFSGQGWVFEPIPTVTPPTTPTSTYQQLRSMEYPPMTDYLDGIVKGDQAQIQKYIDDCLAVKARIPKEQLA